MRGGQNVIQYPPLRRRVVNKTLILTGWSKAVYMTAAAAALEALKWKADVAGVSMDALAGALMISRK